MSYFFRLFKTPELPRIEIRNLEGEVIFALPWSSLAGQDLSHMTFLNANFNEMDLSDANCQGAEFIGCEFVGAKLRRADLRGAQINFCDLSRATLADAKIHGADFASTSFGDRRTRCDMLNVEGLHEAVIDPHELVHRGRFDTLRGRRNRDVQLRRDHAKIADYASRPLRPRCLLLLGDPMGPNQQYEHAPKPRKLGRRRTRYPRRSAPLPSGDAANKLFEREEN